MEEFIAHNLFELIMTGAVAILGAGYKMSLREFKKQKIEREAIKSLLRSELISLHGKYMSEGDIPIYGQENIQAMYNAYHSLGGNGTITKLVNDIMKLPTRKN